MNTDLETQQVFWDGVTGEQDFESRYICDPAVSIDETLKAISPIVFRNAATMVVELGCGTGRVTRMIAGQLPKGSEIIGIDISGNILKVAEERAEGSDNISFIKNHGNDIPLPDKTVSTLYSMQMFQHVDKFTFRCYIMEAWRVLRKDGLFKFQFVQGDQQDTFLHYKYKTATVVKWLELIGFEIVSTENMINPEWTWITARKP